VNKQVIWALIILALTVLLLIFARGTEDVNLLVTKLKNVQQALVHLVFVGVGVVVGLLLK
jgi:hypothetical protein